MNELQNFTNGFFNLDVKVEGEEILFSAEQVAKSLGFITKTNGTEYVRWNRVNEFLPQVAKVEKGSFISEPMVYKLAFKANNAVSEKFTDWLAVEVLPTIRKHGAYMTDKKAQDVLHGNGLADLLIQAGEQLKEKDVIISQLKPKALFAEAVESSKGSIIVRDLAKILKQNNVEIGEKRLFAWLRDNGYLIKKLGSDYNSPTQRSMNLGVMEFTENTVVRNSGDVILRKTPKVTGKGQTYFVGKFLNRSLGEQFN